MKRLRIQRTVLIVLVVCLLLLIFGGGRTQETILAITQAWQHKDTKMWCEPEGEGKRHPWKHGVRDHCVHCLMYSAPAACAMYGMFVMRPAPFVLQDYIYDNSKESEGEILGNGSLETHGLGLYAGIGGKPAEIQNAFTYAVGVPPFQHGPLGSGNPVITCEIIRWYIDNNQPILWVDIASWPADQDTIPDELYYNSGHCKIIAGYDDMDTPDDCGDDAYLIHDPWITSDTPYWLPGEQVIDSTDIYLSVLQPLPVAKESWSSIKRIFEE